MDRDFWFSKKNHKFLHNIDTFYFSVKLADDLTKDGKADNVLMFREHLKRFDPSINGAVPFTGPRIRDHLNVISSRPFAYFYTVRLEHPDMYDIFIAPIVPTYETGSSVTPEIIVQIRSKMLWEMGVTAAFERCMYTVKVICDFYGFTITNVQENRTDFCWHTNALQNPERYLRIDNLTPMKVSQFRRIRYDYEFISSDSYESDYVALGRRGDKCYLRFYLKTKEVVEMQKKPWFFHIWLFNGLISRYDFYVLDLTYRHGNSVPKNSRWKYIDIARLHFALENMDLDPIQLSAVQQALAFEKEVNGVPNYKTITLLANQLTPALTKILNVEYQVMRRMSKSFELYALKDNSSKGVSKRIYDFFDNRSVITEYLTHDVFRLVDPNDTNKSRCDYTDFWHRLRSTKQIDVSMPKQLLKLCRHYNSDVNVEMRKRRSLHSILSFGAVTNPDNDIYSDATELLCMLNDNDIVALDRYKRKVLLRLPREGLSDDDSNGD